MMDQIIIDCLIAIDLQKCFKTLILNTLCQLRAKLEIRWWFGLRLKGGELDLTLALEVVDWTTKLDKYEISHVKISVV